MVCILDLLSIYLLFPENNISRRGTGATFCWAFTLSHNSNCRVKSAVMKVPSWIKPVPVFQVSVVKAGVTSDIVMFTRIC